MSYEEIISEINRLKRRYGKLLTNVIPQALKKALGYQTIQREEGLIIIAQEPYRKRGYFAVKDEKTLMTLLKGLPHNVIFEWIYKDENLLEEIMYSANIKHYATYMRISRTWEANPYEVAEKGVRLLLQKRYDCSCGEYAVEEDAEELYELSKSVFDVNCDDVFTVEEWRKRILNKEVLIYREEKEIIACYVFRLEGKKLYSNIAINQGSADILYSMERRIFTEMWEKGIRVYYAWFDVKNKQAISRNFNNAKYLLSYENVIYNAIYQS